MDDRKKKRVRSTPTGRTPKQPAKRLELERSKARRGLNFSSSPSPWSIKEEKALVEFVMLTSPDAWPLAMKEVYWTSASEFIHARCGTSQLRTSGGCRSRVTMKFQHKYLSPLEAEEKMGLLQPSECIQLSDSSDSARRGDVLNSDSCDSAGPPHGDDVLNRYSCDSAGPPRGDVLNSDSCDSAGSLQGGVLNRYSCDSASPPRPQSDVLNSDTCDSAGPSCGDVLDSYSPKSVETIDMMASVISGFQKSSADQQLSALCEMFCCHAKTFYGVVVPSDFVSMSILGMKQLEKSGRINVIHELAKGLGTMRPDGSDSCFPTSRMPMGLLQYIVQFFNTEPGKAIFCSDDYRDWLLTMYSLFGTKFSKLFCGPMWSTDANSSKRMDPLEAHVNVPGLGERTMRRIIASKEFTTGSEIQVAALTEAHKLHPDARWWIKGDGCDVVSGLEESVCLEWHGDVDFGIGELESMYSTYLKRLTDMDIFKSNVCLGENRAKIVGLLSTEQEQMKADNLFVTEELQKTSDSYASKVKDGSSKEKTLLELAWKLDDLSRLSTDGRKMLVEMVSLKDLLADRTTNIAAKNIVRRLVQLHQSLFAYIRGLYKHKRIAATHIFVVLISAEKRVKKPYALPIQCFSYAGIGIEKMREILNRIVTAMADRNMQVNGFISNGEYNSMRAKGYTRPLSVLQIKANARKKYRRMRKKSMIDMLTPLRTHDGQVIAVHRNPAVSTALLEEIFSWKQSGANDSDVYKRLRLKMVPPGYTVQSWTPGEEEDDVDILRSILAQLEYRHQVCSWDEKGVPFRTFMYVPEVHPITNKVFHEREDFGHVLKRMAQSTRLGGPKKLQLERFTEAMYDEVSGLTFPALTGQRKQSVRDAEILFSEGVQKFMERSGYQYEGKFISAVRNWRRACDERGLSSLQRCRFNYQLLQLILDELMPWHSECYDFSTLEVNRSVNVLGFTRETVIALTTNIESMEWKRTENVESGLPPENPRASTTDDVECMFSVMRDLTGKHFTLREVKYTWRKVCIEFTKRLDPDIGYYYFTSSHDRFYEGERPHFDEQTRKIRSQRVRRREQPANLMFGRATLPVSSTRSIRMKFHNLPLELPPIYNVKTQHLDEHSYYTKK